MGVFKDQTVVKFAFLSDGNIPKIPHVQTVFLSPVLRQSMGKYAWLMQDKCSPVSPAEYSLFEQAYIDFDTLDIHPGNVGKDSKGNVVLFDW